MQQCPSCRLDTLKQLRELGMVRSQSTRSKISRLFSRKDKKGAVSPTGGESNSAGGQDASDFEISGPSNAQHTTPRGPVSGKSSPANINDRMQSGGGGGGPAAAVSSSPTNDAHFGNDGHSSSSPALYSGNSIGKNDVYVGAGEMFHARGNSGNLDMQSTGRSNNNNMNMMNSSSSSVNSGSVNANSSGGSGHGGGGGGGNFGGDDHHMYSSNDPNNNNNSNSNSNSNDNSRMSPIGAAHVPPSQRPAMRVASPPPFVRSLPAPRLARQKPAGGRLWRAGEQPRAAAGARAGAEALVSRPRIRVVQQLQRRRRRRRGAGAEPAEGGVVCLSVGARTAARRCGDAVCRHAVQENRAPARRHHQRAQRATATHATTRLATTRRCQSACRAHSAAAPGADRVGGPAAGVCAAARAAAAAGPVRPVVSGSATTATAIAGWWGFCCAFLF